MATPVKEIIIAAAEMIGRSDLVREASAESSSSEELSLLLGAYNRIASEVALDYFPSKAQDNIEVRTGKIPYTQLVETPVRILGVTRIATKEDMPYEVFPDYILLAENDFVTVTYTYAPRKKKLTDNVSFDPRISPRLLAYGTASEFLIASGRYEEAGVFDRKYREALKAADILKKHLTMRSRRWA